MEQVVDVSGLVPEARSIVKEIAEVYLRHLDRWFIGLVAYGSTVNGGFVPGLSDIDLLLILKDSAFTENGELQLDKCLTICGDIARIDTMPFRSLECFPLAYPSQLPEGLTGSPTISGTYHIVAGDIPIKEMTTQELRDESREYLTGLTPPTPEWLLSHGEKHSWPNLRELHTWVWGVARSVLTLRHSDAIPWGLGRDRVIELFPKETSLGRELRAFHAALLAFYPSEESVEEMLAIVKHGAMFLREVKCWWHDFA